MGTAQARQPGYEYVMDPLPDYRPRYAGAGRLKNKVALVTGGDSGIGRAVAVLFAREGARLALSYKDERRDAEETRKLVEKEGSTAILLRGDIGDKTCCERIVEETVEAYDRLDVVIGNAAEQHARENVEDISEEQLRRTFDTNIFGNVFLVQAALPHLKEGSSIILTTSVTAYRGQDVLLDYASTKGAILSLVRGLASKLADKGIRVNGVAPGPIWTPLIPASFPPEKVETFGTNTPLGRPGQPNEVAPSYLFLACEDGSYMSGQVLHPNGGEAVSS
ncbi:SDR family oxidoreductase [Rhodobium gokarnense]|uniref:NAD(P)-dependent dehydrogenase (Short-subunit alcohol dehydrogenase family) n=1 Tax=Rhodobium gokarnense TaxID=364296 RepID=A0ABT3HG36_9HYPH|nr:SDR family oxidoreductase [Rhodobium gokarnense]MCW2309360.1 NAD(P)-dependent dehydrogenase (short-subunit alcohol dehydrogenase family) [Rhodobium gokarnense]